MSEKIYYTMGEVAEMFDVNASLIRYWGTQFSCLKPHRNKKGNRLFSPADIETLKRIYHYVKECGMTLEGAKRALRGDRSEGEAGSSDMELLERLQAIRSTLIAVRDSLGEPNVVAVELPDDDDVEEAIEPVVEQFEETVETEVVEEPTAAVVEPTPQPEESESQEEPQLELKQEVETEPQPEPIVEEQAVVAEPEQIAEPELVVEKSVVEPESQPQRPMYREQTLFDF